MPDGAIPIVEYELIVKPQYASERLDHFLIRMQVHPSRTFIQHLIKEGEIRVNGRAAKQNYKVKPGDRVFYRKPRPMPLELIPEAILLDILYEDEALLIINKPPGLVMHPAPGHYTGTLVHALLHHCRGLSVIGGRERPGLVHRLDKDTSGVVVVATTDDSHRFLSQQFKAHSIERRYQALVSGRVQMNQGVINVAIGRDKWERKKISPRTGRPREAVTTYRVCERFPEATRVEVWPKTGRTHQIRVHFAEMRHPILGDRTYGGRAMVGNSIPIDRQMLHAEHLGFIHPVSRKPVSFSAPPPPDMERIIDLLRRQGA